MINGFDLTSFLSREALKGLPGQVTGIIVILLFVRTVFHRMPNRATQAVAGGLGVTFQLVFVGNGSPAAIVADVINGLIAALGAMKAVDLVLSRRRDRRDSDRRPDGPKEETIE